MFCLQPCFFNLVWEWSLEIEFGESLLRDWFRLSGTVDFEHLLGWTTSESWLVTSITSWAVVSVGDPIPVIPMFLWLSVYSCCIKFHQMDWCDYLTVLKFFLKYLCSISSMCEDEYLMLSLNIILLTLFNFLILFLLTIESCLAWYFELSYFKFCQTIIFLTLFTQQSRASGHSSQLNGEIHRVRHILCRRTHRLRNRISLCWELAL